MRVAHAASELEAGSTTVLTLADAPLLQSSENNQHIVTGLNEDERVNELENVNLAEHAKQSDGLKKKRQLELGMGRAGGYAGFDDDEFVELGGAGAPSRMARGQLQHDSSAKQKAAAAAARRGFTIGGDFNQDSKRDPGDDLFAGESGKAVSLEPSQADVQASDFMTEQEDLEFRGKDKKRDKASKKRKKDKFDSKKKKKKDKKNKTKHTRRRHLDDEDEDEDESEDEIRLSSSLRNKKKQPSGKKTLADELEETAVEEESTSAAKKKSRKRSRSEDDDDDDDNEQEGGPAQVPSGAATKLEPTSKTNNKRAKYDAIMAKGNARTQQAFAPKQQSQSKEQADDDLDEEPDDAFLNAALAKARRLKKLRDMNPTTSTISSTGGIGARGADAVVEAVQSMPDVVRSAENSGGGSGGGGVVFAVDDTREFTRALRARSGQQVREKQKIKKEPAANTITTVQKAPQPPPAAAAAVKQEPMVETVQDNKMEDDDEDVDMAELAKEIKEDDLGDNGDSGLLEGTTGSAMPVGRGLAGVLNLFKQTGDLTRKNAGKEELRGRAKDERTYEDYEALDLDSVVKIDKNNASEKDRDLASRQVKLEYRDKHGRLLTRKEAFRDLCYQFHGHGSSKRKEEKRQKQMAREQAEARLASQALVGSDGGPGTLGALKATQKATGKAFVVHKT
jgi:U4/U6.U5 tri-snRNP-associated protein 1